MSSCIQKYYKGGKPYLRNFNSIKFGKLETRYKNVSCNSDDIADLKNEVEEIREDYYKSLPPKKRGRPKKLYIDTSDIRPNINIAVPKKKESRGKRTRRNIRARKALGTYETKKILNN